MQITPVSSINTFRPYDQFSVRFNESQSANATQTESSRSLESTEAYIISLSAEALRILQENDFSTEVRNNNLAPR